MVASELLFRYGTPKQIRFRNSGDFSPAAVNTLIIGTPTDVQLDLTGVVDAAARQSAQFDFGEKRAEWYRIIACLEWLTTGPTPPQAVGFYLNETPNSTAANGNVGGCSGVDAAYTGYSGGTLADSIKQLRPIGSFVTEGQISTTAEKCICGDFSPAERYGSLVVLNNSGEPFNATDAIEIHVVFNPVTPEAQ